MRKIKAVSVSVLTLILVMLLSGCGSSATPETLYQSDTVQVVQNGSEIAVYDLVSDNEYSFIQRRVKRSETPTVAYTTVSTDTIQIDVLTNSLRIYDKEENKAFFIIVQKRMKKGGVLKNGS